MCVREITSIVLARVVLQMARENTIEACLPLLLSRCRKGGGERERKKREEEREKKEERKERRGGE